MRFKCPHCGATAHTRTSRDMSETSRESYLQCTNVECAHTWVNLTSAVRTIAPSMTPNPKVFIPLSPRSPAQPSAAKSQMDLPIELPHPRLLIPLQAAPG